MSDLIPANQSAQPQAVHPVFNELLEGLHNLDDDGLKFYADTNQVPEGPPQRLRYLLAKMRWFPKSQREDLLKAYFQVTGQTGLMETQRWRDLVLSYMETGKP